MKKLLSLIFILAIALSSISCSDTAFVMNGEFEIEELSLIGFSENENAMLSFKMKNTTEKSISSINFLLVSYDKDGLLVQEKKLSYNATDWNSGEVKEFSEVLYSLAITNAKLYVYSVIFTDGYTFGDAEADEDRIQQNCKSYSVKMVMDGTEE